jgi:hypothetical protein
MRFLLTHIIMKKFLLSFFTMMCVYVSMAQSPEDVLRYSYFPQNGSARNAAIGGAMGSLGGDINAMYVNPAGLGMYKTREFVLSPGLNLIITRLTSGELIPGQKIMVLILEQAGW